MSLLRILSKRQFCERVKIKVKLNNEGFNLYHTRKCWRSDEVSKVYGFFEPMVFSLLKELIIITIKNLKKIPR